jgi:hypothetical protein
MEPIAYALAHPGVGNEKVRKSFIVLCIVCLLSLVFQETGRASISEGNEDLAEAVFRYQLQNFSHLLPDGGSYYLQLGFGPRDEFMVPFRDHTPTVKKGSECMITDSLQVIDRQTQKPGLLLKVGSVIKRDSASAEIEGGFYLNGKSASWGTYLLVVQNGEWVVAKYFNVVES